MSRQQAAAITNNEKVFPVFAKKLSADDGDVFCSTALKLSTWLNSEKAYYPAARPKVSLFLCHQVATCFDVRVTDREFARSKVYSYLVASYDLTLPAPPDCPNNSAPPKGRRSERSDSCIDLPAAPHTMGQCIRWTHSNGHTFFRDVSRTTSSR
jgi:hypothetical protein